MVAPMSNVTVPAEEQSSSYAAPDPKARARELLEESLHLFEEALRQLKTDNPGETAEIVGKASDRVGSALYFLRAATRR
jgi:hypothetical protein